MLTKLAHNNSECEINRLGYLPNFNFVKTRRYKIFCISLIRVIINLYYFATTIISTGSFETNPSSVTALAISTYAPGSDGVNT